MRPRVVQDSLSQRGGSWRLSYHLAFEDGTTPARFTVQLEDDGGEGEKPERAEAAIGVAAADPSLPRSPNDPRI